jgi:tetratricopeptide (TPR) repeat protein
MNMQQRIVGRFGVLLVSSLVILGGCSSVSKVKRTLALNDIHIQAAVAEDRGDDEAAYDLWTQYVDRRPNSRLAEYRLGLVETRLGLYSQAVGHLRVAHDLAPGNLEYLEALSSALALDGRSEALLKLLRQTVDEGPAGSGYLRLAKFATQVGQMDEAKIAIESAIIHWRGDLREPYLAMADFAHAIEDTDLEILSLRHVLWFDPADAMVLERIEGLGIIPGPSLAVEPTH